MLEVLNTVNPAMSPQYILCGAHPPKFYTGSAAPVDTIVKAIEARASDLPPKKILSMEKSFGDQRGGALVMSRMTHWWQIGKFIPLFYMLLLPIKGISSDTYVTGIYK